MENIYELSKFMDEIISELVETDSNPRSPTYFDYVFLHHEFDNYMERAILLSSQIRIECKDELDEFWKQRGHHWNTNTNAYERILLL